MEEKRHIEIVKERIVDRFIIFSHYKMAKTKVERIIDNYVAFSNLSELILARTDN